jgi:glycosyltransferase involved in cell wall biosynthesis
MRKKHIIQMIHTLSYEDGASLDALGYAKILERNKAAKTMIYAEHIDPGIPSRVAKHYSEIPKLHDDDVILFHLGISSKMNQIIRGLPGRKIFRYHNVTPPHWYQEYDPTYAAVCEKSLEEVRELADVPNMGYADSAFNQRHLLSLGYDKCEIRLVPIRISMDAYKQEPDPQLLAKYQDGYTNILFTGRIVPNKKQEDIIRAFACYQKYINQKSRLILAGSYDGMEVYYKKLQRYAELLGAQNVIFTGHLRFEELMACYHAADVFLCLSEYEGFCISLVEAMYFHIPIIAYKAAAVPETLGGGGILLDDKKSEEIAGLMDYAVRNKEQVKEYYREKQDRQVDMFTVV